MNCTYMFISDFRPSREDIRAGWQTALICAPPAGMSVPSSLDVNMHSLFTKLPSLSHSNSCLPICDLHSTHMLRVRLHPLKVLLPVDRTNTPALRPEVVCPHIKTSWLRSLDLFILIHRLVPSNSVPCQVLSTQDHHYDESARRPFCRQIDFLFFFKFFPTLSGPAIGW